MKILLLGEYSNLHATLAEGLRKLGHQVLVVSDGTYIYDYPRDIALNRRGTGRLAAVSYALKLLRTLPCLTGFDIVQLINPDFLTLKAERQFSIYRFLRRHNKHLVLGAFGNDWQWVKRNLEDRFMRYGDFYTEHEDRTQVPHVKKVLTSGTTPRKADSAAMSPTTVMLLLPASTNMWKATGLPIRRKPVSFRFLSCRKNMSRSLEKHSENP